MAKSVAVIGATGIQGGSVIRALLNDGTYSVTAITRNSESNAAKKLASEGVRVVEADLEDVESLKAAFSGSYAIFAVTNFFEPFVVVGEEKAIETEERQGINLAKAAAATPTLEHYVWSTFPNAHQISGGRASVPHYVAKNRVDDYIRSQEALLKKTTFLWISCYASNFNYPFFRPFRVPTASDRYIQVQATASSVPIQWVGDATVNIGLFAHSILNQPGKTLPGKIVFAATDSMTAAEALAKWASVQGKEADLVQIDRATYYSLWPKWAEVMDKMYQYWELVQEKSFSSDGVILTKEDLGVVGLVDTASAFAEMRD